MQSIFLENRTKLTIKGATKILSSTNIQAIIELQDQNLMISGQNIEITKLNLEENEVCFNGEINCIKYCSKNDKKNIIKRLFK